MPRLMVRALPLSHEPAIEPARTEIPSAYITKRIDATDNGESNRARLVYLRPLLRRRPVVYKPVRLVRAVDKPTHDRSFAIDPRDAGDGSGF